MHTLIYTSRATRDISQDDLLDILTNARANNRNLQVTGMLLYYKRSFMQVLEGVNNVIFDLLDDCILPDSRHTGVSLTIDYPLEQRLFSDWTMGFVNLDHKPPPAIDGFRNFFTEGFAADVTLGSRSMAQALLLSLKKEYEEDMG